MRVFSRVAETGNFSAVAKHMDCSAGNVSRAVVSLEEHLHTRLLQRTTRSVSLTECGERYYHRCKKILADLDAAEAEASNAHTLPRGRLRVHAVPDIGLKQLTSTIDDFDVSIVSASTLPDSRNISKLIGQCERILVAAPEYLAGHPIAAEKDLAHHTLMQVSSAFDAPPEWPADTAGNAAGTELAGHFIVNNMQALRIALLEGAGVGAVPTYSVAQDIKEGKLVQLFPGYPLENVNVFAIYPSRQYVDAKVKTFVEFLTTSLRQKLDVQVARLQPGRPVQTVSGQQYAELQ
jgi:DNA-binding transcriptional LysR family regulator